MSNRNRIDRHGIRTRVVSTEKKPRKRSRGDYDSRLVHQKVTDEEVLFDEGSSGSPQGAQSRTRIESGDCRRSSCQANGATTEFVGSGYQPGMAVGEQGVWVPQWVSLITRTLTERIVLAQLAYWFGRTPEGRARARIQWQEHYWVSKTYAVLGSETILTRDQVRGALRGLIGRRIVISRQREAGAIPVYRLDASRIHEEFERALTEHGRKDR